MKNKLFGDTRAQKFLWEEQKIKVYEELLEKKYSIGLEDHIRDLKLMRDYMP